MGVYLIDVNTGDVLSVNGPDCYANTDTGEFVGYIFDKPSGQSGRGRMGHKISVVMPFDVLKNHQVIDKARP
jgi:hypothetical protein